MYMHVHVHYSMQREFLERVRYISVSQPHGEISGVVSGSGPRERDTLHVDAFRVSECVGSVGALDCLQVACISRECSNHIVIFVTHLAHDAHNHVVARARHRD